ncbi:c-type heme family protein [Pelagerythrobacter aerophilus]
MNSATFRSVLLITGVCELGACSQAETSLAIEAEFLRQSEELTARFQSELQMELSSALSEVGPAGAIGVCQSAAPAIGARLSEDSGFTVSRVARRNRNAVNAISPDLEALYSELESSPMQDGSPRPVHGTVGERLVYLRAIPMQEQPCSTCHGSNIDPALSEAISQSYPEDLAVGFEPGELRGAFLVERQKQR